MSLQIKKLGKKIRTRTRRRVILLLLWLLAVIGFVGHDKNARIERSGKTGREVVESEKRTWKICCHFPQRPRPSQYARR